jgi:hypothetical protein
MFGQIELKRALGKINVLKKYKFKLSGEKDRKKTQKCIKNIIHENHIHNTHDEYVRALGNALHHGSCPVKCTVYVGEDHQLMCVIKDSGKGFNYKEVVLKFMKGEVYYHNHGLGTRTYARNPDLLVDWSHEGRQIILYYRGQI